MDCRSTFPATRRDRNPAKAANAASLSGAPERPPASGPILKSSGSMPAWPLPVATRDPALTSERAWLDPGDVAVRAMLGLASVVGRTAAVPDPGAGRPTACLSAGLPPCAEACSWGAVAVAPAAGAVTEGATAAGAATEGP